MNRLLMEHLKDMVNHLVAQELGSIMKDKRIKIIPLSLSKGRNSARCSR